jgi:hypothetical protein
MPTGICRLLAAIMALTVVLPASAPPPGGPDLAALRVSESERHVVRAEPDGDENGHFIMIYTAEGEPFRVDTTVLPGPDLKAWWFDPGTGIAIDAGSVPKAPSVDFFPPDMGEGDAGRDWVLVVIEAARGVGPPGRMPA